MQEGPLGPSRGQAESQRGGFVRVQGERTRSRPEWDYEDGKEGTGRVRGQETEGAGLATDRLGEGGGLGHWHRGLWVPPSHWVHNGEPRRRE